MDQAGPAGSRFHTVPHICVGEGPKNQTSGFGVPALPGRQAKAPQIALAGWERAHTYLNAGTGRVRLYLLLLSKGGRSTLRVPGPFSSHEPLSPVPWSLEDQAGRRFWRCYCGGEKKSFREIV